MLLLKHFGVDAVLSADLVGAPAPTASITKLVHFESGFSR